MTELGQDRQFLGSSTEPEVKPLIKESAMRNFMTDPDTWDESMPKEVMAQINLQTKSSSNPRVDKMKMANNVFLASRSGLTMPEVEGNPQLKNSYARQVFGSKADVSDEEFFGMASQHLTDKDNEGMMIQQGFQNMVSNFEDIGSTDDWFRENRDELSLHEGWNNEHFDAYRENFRDMRNKIENTASKYTQEINGLEKAFASFHTGGSMTEEFAEDKQLRAIARKLTGVPKEERDLIMRIAAGRSASTEGAERRGSGLSSIAPKMGEQVFRGAQAFATATQNTVAGITNTAEDRLAGNIVRQIQDAFNGVVDPNLGAGYWTQGFMDFAQSAPRTAVAMTGGGIVLNALATANDLEREFIDNGVDPETARWMGAVGSLPHSALEYVSANLLLGRVPGSKLFLDKVPGLKKILGPIESYAQKKFLKMTARLGGHLGIQSVEQVGQELAQNFVRPVVQDIAGIFSELIPDVTSEQWDKEIGAIPGASFEVFAAMLPLIAFGGGHATFRDSQKGAAYLGNQDFLKAAGLGADQIELINSAPANEKGSVLAGLWTHRSGIGSREQRQAIEDLNQAVADTTGLMNLSGITPGAPSIEVARPEFMESLEGIPNTMTAHAIGLGVANLTEAQGLKDAWQNKKAEAKQAAQTGDENLMNIMQEAALLREAFEAATGTLSAKTHFEEEVAAGRMEAEPIYPAQINEDGVLEMVKKEPSEAPEATPAPVADPDAPLAAGYTVEKDADGNMAIKDPLNKDVGTASTQEDAANMVNQHAQEAKNAERSKRDTETRAKASVESSSIPAPERDGTPLAKGPLALNKKEMEAERQMAGSEPFDSPTRQRFLEVLNSAKLKDIPANTKALAKELLRKAFPITAEQHASLILEAIRLTNQFELLQTDAATAIDQGRFEKADRLQKQAESVRWDLDEVQEAADSAGTEISRALSIRRMRVNRGDFSLAVTLQRATIAKRESLTREEKALFTKLTNRVKKQDEEIERIQGELDAERKNVSKANAELFVAEGQKKRSPIAIEQARARREDLQKQLKALGFRMNDATNVIGLSVEAASIVAQIAETYIAEGTNNLSDLSAQMKETFPDLSDFDIFDALGNRVKRGVKAIKNEAKSRIRELTKQARFWAKISLAVDGIVEKGKTDKSSVQVKALRKIMVGMRIQAGKTIFDELQYKRVSLKIDQIIDHLESGLSIVPEPKTSSKRSEKLEGAFNELKELRREYRSSETLKQLNQMLEKGEDQIATERPQEKNERIRVIKDLIKAARKELMKKEKNESTRERLVARLDSLEGQIRTGIREAPAPSKVKSEKETVDIIGLRENIRELEALMRTQDSIQDLKDQLSGAKPFKVSAKEQTFIKSEALIEAIAKRSDLRREVARAVEARRKMTKKEIAKEIFLLPRATLATGDFSGAFRQFYMLGTRHPKTFVKAFAKAANAAIFQRTADEVLASIQSHPNHAQRLRHKLYIAEIDADISKNEEAFYSSMAERIWGFGRIVKASNRHMTTMGNLMRVAAFDQFIEKHPETTPEEKTAWAAFVNVASGRGDLKQFNRHAKLLSTAFFAPRWAISRFQAGGALFVPVNFKSKAVREEIAKVYASYLGTTLSFIMLASMIPGVSVGIDPEDSDFGKLVLGDTRFDIWGGMQQPARLIIGALLRGSDTIGIRDMNHKLDPTDAFFRFLRYKFSPTVNIALELWTGEDAIGRPTGVVKTAYSSVAPLIMQDTLETLWNTDFNFAKAGTVGLAAFVGISTQEHSPISNEELIKRAEKSFEKAQRKAQKNQ